MPKQRQMTVVSIAKAKAATCEARKRHKAPIKFPVRSLEEFNRWLREAYPEGKPSTSSAAALTASRTPGKTAAVEWLIGRNTA
jgi:hypothetical protein